MSFYWLAPDWKQATCPRCGANIWDSGGDPDWGLCYSCFSHDVDSRREAEQRPRCDICGKGEAVAAENGYAVCSLECDHEARNRPPKGEQP